MYATLVLVALGVAGDDPHDTDIPPCPVEYPFPGPSTWTLESFEEDGKRDKRLGDLKLGSDGCGVLKVFPRAPWEITDCRVKGANDSGSFEWDVHCVNQVGDVKFTLYGVYRVRNDRLWLCFSFGKQPPEFSTKPDDNRTLLVLRRVK
ncbi:MAG TPA: hypothetical protein VMS17_07755 [Gemmataceae bacterium]|nr:hypothetical protein [Gemmataceae bacterium]